MNTPQQPKQGTEQTTVRAIDVGYGNVKSTLRHTDLSGPIECEIFASRSPVSAGKGLAAGVLKGRDTVVIKVGGNEYEVGKEVNLALGAHDESVILDRNFCLSDAYLARMRGALYYMRGYDAKGKQYTPSDTLEMLVVGLPVNTYKDKELRQSLVKRLIGLHELPDDRSVTIERVLVVPQPLGAFYEYAFMHGMLDTLKHQVNLIIDPGFFTFDWLMSSGLTPIDQRSDAVNRGVSAILKITAEEINKKESFKTTDSKLVAMMDDHFRTGLPFRPFNKNIDLEKYLQRGMTVVNEAVASMVSMVGDGADIQNIILAGGGAKFYLEAIKASYPHHEIIVMDEPVYSNVRGFQILGEQMVLARRVRDRKASLVTG